tara:strand:- start:430 stop:1836 length:1407 start_codon:yes stop_codon:yes gene_type:complete
MKERKLMNKFIKNNISNKAFLNADFKNSITVNLNSDIKKENNSNDNLEFDLKNILKLYNDKNYNEMLIATDFFTKKYPEHIEGLNAHGLACKNCDKFSEAVKTFEKVVLINPNIDYIYTNLANTLYLLGKNNEAIANFKKTLELNPSNTNALNGLGLSLSNQGDEKGAIKVYLEALATNPKISDANYNVANSYKRIKDYEKASHYYSKSKHPKAMHVHLECLYLDKYCNEDRFYELLSNLIDSKKLTSLTACISAHASVRFSREDPYPFCKNPKDFIRKFNLFNHSEFDKDLIKSFLEDINNSKINARGQELLVNGKQTSGNLFNLEYSSVKKIKKIIEDTIEDYRELFKDTNNGFIKNWPKNYTLFGWIVMLKTGGSLGSHMHREGWLSSSVYLKRPKKLLDSDGDIQFSLDGANMPRKEGASYLTEIIDIKEGDMVSFPSSLFHSTIPFNSPEERLTLAFDIIPKD